MAKQEVKEWLNKADKDLDEAKFLLDNNRPSEDIAFFLHQAAEKYLKGFLLSKQLIQTTDTLGSLVKSKIL